MEYQGSDSCLKQQKRDLRKVLLKQRQTLDEQQWQARSRKICQQLQTNFLFSEAKTVLSYFSFRNEPDLSSLWEVTTRSKKWGFPRCVANHLSWYFWQPNQPLENNKYKIPEPLVTAVAVLPQTVDLILVPTVACDYEGTRLGYGGGYYDRFLSRPQWQNIPTVGITFDFAYLTELPRDSWDIRLDFVCTETQFS